MGNAWMIVAALVVGAVSPATSVAQPTKRLNAESMAALVKGKSVTGFTNTEEAAVGLTDIVPFLIEDMLTSRGGRYSKKDD